MSDDTPIRGRPSLFTKELADEICRRLAAGESLRSITRLPDMPAESTVRAWAVDDYEGFSAQYARAREIGYHGLFDEILEIADTTQEGVKTVEKATGVETTTFDMIEHRRLRVDARKWMLAKALPKVYGDKLTAELTGKDGGPIETTSPLEDARRTAFLLRSAQRQLEDQAQPEPLH